MSVTGFYPNARANLAFSGKRDVMTNRLAASASVKFGREQRPVNNIWTLTDFNDQTSNARAYQRFQEVREFVAAHAPVLHQVKQDGIALNAQSRQLKKNFKFNPHNIPAKGAVGQPEHIDIADIPARNIDYASQALFELAQDPNKDVFIHVTDPGVGSGKKAHERSILVTRNHGVHIGPNNGTLGLLTQFLKRNNEPFKLLEIDLNKTNQLETIRRGKVDTGSTFHGRDVFAVAAGAIAGGLAPESLATDESKSKPLEPEVSDYGHLAELPTQLGQTADIRANRDNTAGNLVLNVPLSQAEFDGLLAKNPVFTVTTEQGKTLDLPLKRTFGQVSQGEPLIYLGSKRSPDLSKRFLEVALNCGDVAQALGLDKQEKPARLSLTLKKQETPAQSLNLDA